MSRRQTVRLVPTMPQPGRITEGPIHKIQGVYDWQRIPGYWDSGSFDPPGVFNGPVSVSALPVTFHDGTVNYPDPQAYDRAYNWRPSGDGTQPLYPSEADLAKIYGYWPVLNAKLSGAGDYPELLGQPGTPGEDGGHEGWKLFFQATSTIAIVALAGLGIGAYLSERSERRKGRR